MEGFLSVVALADAKKVWQTEFVKFDDISAQFLGFTDRSQAELKWKLHLKNADVTTPLPGDPKCSQVPNVDETPYCFYAHEVTSCGNEVLVVCSAPNEDAKKQWMKRLQQAAKDGPLPPRFGPPCSPRSTQGTPTNSTGTATSSTSSSPTNAAKQAFLFQARVTQVRLHDGGKYAEYMVTCHCEIFSRVANRRLAKEWHVWHRYSEFDALNEALKISLGADKMADVSFFKTHRDALRSLFGWWSLDQDFLDHRRFQLDTFITRVCAIDGAADFFQSHSDATFKKFLAFDDNCEDVDHPPCKTSHSHETSTSPKKHSSHGHGVHDAEDNLRTSDMSPRDSDANSASYSSAVMSPMAASAVSSYESLAATVADPPAQVAPATAEPAADDSTKETRRGSESRRSRKKSGKATTANEDASMAKENPGAVAARQEVEIVRQPTPTSGKKGKKNH